MPGGVEGEGRESFPIPIFCMRRMWRLCFDQSLPKLGELLQPSGVNRVRFAEPLFPGVWMGGFSFLREERLTRKALPPL